MNGFVRLGAALCCACLCLTPFALPQTATAAAARAATRSVYDKQPDVSEKELLAFLELLPQFRQWTRAEQEEAHPVLRAGKADFLYSPKATQWVTEKGWDARRFFCVMGRMAAALVMVEEGGNAMARPKDMPEVSKAELELARKHLGSILKASMDNAQLQ
ncbi:serine/threonine protein phosphatase [uncultured Desulfovibrio sp.]|uniref:Serine/threonine protein phosphatase n=1 Tax=Candidatus Desulfovibrio intestinavium TaxID=2838534 RepID=A0A9D2HM46_9BACT|nr:serine/threonine protein phosphatase [uncultured Desulfovibrio sp.]HJA78682.1 serine/threonine protein phosphatase [Candidatus Desulfovibrio intestinavium]